MPEEKWAPTWNEEQLSNIISQYKKNPKIYTPDLIQQIKEKKI